MEKPNLKKRSEILEAALKLFSEKGFKRSTVDEIATKAGVGKGTIYLYFETKEDIFWTGIEEGMFELGKTFEQIAREKGYMEQIKQTIRAHFDFVENNQDLFTILYKEQANLPKKKDVKDRLLQIHFDIQQRFTRLLEDGMAQNVLRRGDPKYFSAAFIGVLSNLAFHWILNGKAESSAAMADTAFSLILSGIEHNNPLDHPGGASHVS